MPSSLVVPSNQMRSSGHELNNKKFHLNVRKKFFTLIVAEHWSSCPRKVWSLPVQRFSKPTWMCSCHLLQVALPWLGGWTG